MENKSISQDEIKTDITMLRCQNEIYSSKAKYLQANCSR